jgi:hypothetical protein
VLFEKQALIFAQAYHIDARDCGIGLTAPSRTEGASNLFQQRYDRTFDSCFVGCLPGYKDYRNLGVAATWSEINGYFGNPSGTFGAAPLTPRAPDL